MKKYLIILCALTSLVGCTTVNYKEDLDTYKDCLTYVKDNTTGDAWVSNTATIKTIYDYYYEAYTVEINNVQLYEGATLQSATLANLQQYFQETSTDDDTPLYYFFKQEGQTRLSGDLDLSNMRYGWLSNTYWLSFTDEAGRYTAWSMPRVRTIYAAKNTINKGGINLEENAIYPKWRFNIDPENKTVKIDANDVHLRQDANDVHKTLVFRELELPSIPITFTDRGFSFNVPGPIVPTIDGNAALQHEITSFAGEIAFDYSGVKTLTYRILNGEGETLIVTSEFSMLRQ